MSEFVDDLPPELAERFEAAKRRSEARTGSPTISDQQFMAALLEAWALAEREDADPFVADTQEVSA